MNKINNKGFTLLELMSAVVILAIVAVAAIPIVIGIINNSKERAYEESINGIKRAAEQYYMDEGLVGELDITISELLEKKYINSIDDNIPSDAYIHVKVGEHENEYIFSEDIDDNKEPQEEVKYALGDPTDTAVTSVDDYRNLNKKVFIRSIGNQKSLCMFSSNKLSCFDYVGYTAGKDDMREVFEADGGSCDDDGTWIDCFNGADDIECSIMDRSMDCWDWTGYTYPLTTAVERCAIEDDDVYCEEVN